MVPRLVKYTFLLEKNRMSMQRSLLAFKSERDRKLL